MNAPAPDWWNDLYSEDGQHAPGRTRRFGRGSAPAPDRTLRIEHAPAPPPAPEPFEPTVLQAAADLLPADPTRRRRALYLAYNGGAAAVGWWAGMGPAISSALAGADSVSDGVWMGVGLLVVTAVAELPTAPLRNPNRHRVIRAVGWCFRIPAATAALALLLFTPDAAL